MSLIVEDGSRVPDSESYVSIADADAYWAARNNTIWATLDDTSKEAALREATQYLETTYAWIGVRVRVDQSLCWPRWVESGLDKDNRLITSFDIPPKLKQAECELALEQATNGRLDPTLERQTKSETVGPLAVVYADDAVGVRFFPFVDKLVSSLSTGGGYNSLSGRAIRG